MADILRVSTPIASNPAAINSNNAQNATQVGATQVNGHLQAQNEINQNQIPSQIYNAGSVFQTFANKVTETPDLSETLQKLLLGALSAQDGVESAAFSGENAVPTLLSELAEKLNMSESEILENIIFQKDQSTGFGSKLFDVLRDITANDNSIETTNYIGRFLKALDSYTNSEQTMNGIMTQLNNILDRIPRAYADSVREAMGELIMEPDEKGVQSNLQLLKNTILPMLGKYVSMTNDLGVTRDRIQLLMQDLSRLNLSSKDELSERFTELMDYARYNLNLPNEKLNSLQNLFSEVVNNKTTPKNEFIDSLAKALSNTEGLSTTSQTMVNDTINALLLNRSVYMPFNHILLPFMYDGNFMFTEMWVEKDGRNGNAGKSDETNSTKRVYLNFDIQGLGKFQAAIGLADNTVDCLVNYPESVSSNATEIETDIAKIFTKNGFTIGSVKSSNDSFKTELEVLHKIYEGRSSVDVTV